MSVSQADININGTLVWYYCVCKREVWLMARKIVADQEDQFMEIGKLIHESSYERDKKEIQIGDVKLDIVKMEKGQLVIGEVKKSSKFKYAARMQLLLYLSMLREAGVDVRGELFFPEERNREEVVLDDGSLEELEEIKANIFEIIYMDKPPLPVKIPFCKNCAYKEFCWS